MRTAVRVGLLATLALVSLSRSGWTYSARAAAAPQDVDFGDYLRDLPPDLRHAVETILNSGDFTQAQLQKFRQVLDQAKQDLKQWKQIWDGLSPGERQKMLSEFQAMLAGIQGQLDAFLAQLPQAIRDKLKGYMNALLPQIPNFLNKLKGF